MNILEYWTQYMTAEDLTHKTIRERLIFIRRLEREVGDLTTVSRPELIAWISQQDWSNATRVHYRSAMHTFFTWLQDEGMRLDNPAARLPKVKVRRREPNPFTINEIQQLLDAGMYRKTRAMVALHYYLGLRVSEISRVHGNDVSWTEQTLTTVGKGRKKAKLPVPEAAWPLFLDMPRDGYWFPNRTANALHQAGEGHILGNSVSTLIGGAIKRAGLQHRPHDLRAATATEMNKAKISAFVVQGSMRHTNMDTTTRYLGLDVEQIREGFNALPTIELRERSGRQRAA